MSEVVQLIPSRIKNAAVGGYLTGAVDIIDDSLGKDQQALNALFNATGSSLSNFAAIMMVTFNYGYDASTITSPEWKCVMLDSEDKVLAGVRVDNSVFIADILNS